MALSTFSTVGSYIKNNPNSLPAGYTPQPYIWFKFNSGDTYNSSTLTNYGTATGITYTNDTTNFSISSNTFRSLVASTNTYPLQLSGVQTPSTLSFSLSFWVYIKSNTYNFNQFNGMNYLWSSLCGLTGSGGGAGANMVLCWQCTGGAYLQGNSEDGTYSKVSPNNIMLAQPALYHLVYIFNYNGGASTFTIYSNNVQVATGSYVFGATNARNNSVASTNVSNSGGATNATQASFYNGTSWSISHQHTYGYMADIRLFRDVVLTSTNVNYLYTNPCFNTTTTI